MSSYLPVWVFFAHSRESGNPALGPRFRGDERPLQSLHPPLIRFPAVFEIVDQLLIVEAAALLARVGGHVAAEDRQRLFGDAQRLAVTDRAHHAGADELRSIGLDRRIHAGGGNDFVADAAAFRRIGMEDAFVEDALARKLAAHEPREAQVGGTGDEAFLAGGQTEISPLLGEHAVHDAKKLATAADGKGFDSRDPWLLGIILVLLVVGFRSPMAAIHLVQQAELALDEEMHERYLAVIEVREIDPRIEDAAAPVFRMLDGTAAQYAHFDGVVEQDEINGGFQGRARAIILGIEEFGVEQGDIAHFAFALGPRLAEIDHAGPSKLLDPFQGFALGLEHGVDEVQAAALVGEHLRDEQPLLHLAAALGALPHQRTLVVDLLAVGQLRRIAARPRPEQLRDP